jgi:hypothetical protein
MSLVSDSEGMDCVRNASSTTMTGTYKAPKMDTYLNLLDDAPRPAQRLVFWRRISGLGKRRKQMRLAKLDIGRHYAWLTLLCR